MKNNKGMTIIEILISVVIISLCLTLLFSLLIQVRSEENNTNIQSTFKIVQASFIRQIEEDIVNYGVKAVTACELGAANISNIDIPSEHIDDYKCIKIHYAADYIKENIGFIIIYNHYKTFEYDEKNNLVGKEASWSISYQRGSYTTCSSKQPKLTSWTPRPPTERELPNEVDLKEKPYLLYTATSSTNAASLVIPIVNLEGEHYDINLSFTFNGNNSSQRLQDISFMCEPNDKMLECKCLSDESLCRNTINSSDDNTSFSTDKSLYLKNHICP